MANLGLFGNISRNKNNLRIISGWIRQKIKNSPASAESYWFVLKKCASDDGVFKTIASTWNHLQNCMLLNILTKNKLLTWVRRDLTSELRWTTIFKSNKALPLDLFLKGSLTEDLQKKIFFLDIDHQWMKLVIE